MLQLVISVDRESDRQEVWSTIRTDQGDIPAYTSQLQLKTLLHQLRSSILIMFSYLCTLLCCVLSVAMAAPYGGMGLGGFGGYGMGLGGFGGYGMGLGGLGGYGMGLGGFGGYGMGLGGFGGYGMGYGGFGGYGMGFGHGGMMGGYGY